MAFTAAVTKASTTWNSGILIFNVVISNIGDGYYKSTGVFTVPMAGTYVFYASANEYASQEIGLDITLNSVSKVRLAGYKVRLTRLGQTLQRGDRVWVKHVFDKGYWTQTFPVTTFTGFMIQQKVRQ